MKPYAFGVIHRDELSKPEGTYRVWNMIWHNNKLAQEHINATVQACLTESDAGLDLDFVAVPLYRQQDVDALNATIEKFRTIILHAYQICGAHDADERILDVLCDPDTATEKMVGNMLPYICPDYLSMVLALQAKIDALMLEYCPDEMTPEQLANWALHQKPVSPEDEEQIKMAIKK